MRLALVVTPASDDERTQVETLATQVQTITEERVELAWVNASMRATPGWRSPTRPPPTVSSWGIQLAVVRLPEAKRVVVLRPRR